MYTDIYLVVCFRISWYVCVCMYVYVCVCVHACVCVCVCTRAHEEVGLLNSFFRMCWFLLWHDVIPHVRSRQRVCVVCLACVCRYKCRIDCVVPSHSWLVCMCAHTHTHTNTHMHTHAYTLTQTHSRTHTHSLSLSLSLSLTHTHTHTHTHSHTSTTVSMDCLTPSVTHIHPSSLALAFL